MMMRIRQFFRAIRARLTEDDDRYLSRHLSREEKDLFFAMHRADQYHALQVAYTAERLAEKESLPINKRLLIRAALLHDVGRVKGDLDIWGKVFAVLFKACCSRLSRKWAKDEMAGPLRRFAHVLFVYYHHPELGAKKLQSLGLRQEAELAGKHHLPETPEDTAELRLLRRADELN